MARPVPASDVTVRRHVMADDVTVRQARHDDYEAVMAINRAVFFGNDYLPIVYHDFLRDPRTYNFVAEVEGTVVGFQSFNVDGPKQMVGMGSRVRADYMGTGVYKKLMTTGVDLMKRRFPQLEWRVFVAFDSDYYRDEARMAAPPYPIVILERWHTPNWQVSREKLARLVAAHQSSSTSGSHRVQRLPPEVATERLIEAGNNGRGHFSTRHLTGFYNWLPQLRTHANIRRAVLSHHFRFTLATPADGGHVTAVSYSVPYKVPGGTLCCVHYCLTDADPDLFIAHALEHAANAVAVTPPGGNVSFNLRTPMDVDMEVVKAAFTPHLGEARSDNNYRLGTGVCAWQKVHPPKL